MEISKSEFISLPMETILQAALGKKDALRKVLKAFKPYITEQSTIHSGALRGYVDEELAQALRRTLLETIPEFRFKTGA